MNAHRQVLALLHAAGFILARQNKHQVFRRADGVIWVIPSTASDWRTWRNNLSALKRFVREESKQRKGGKS